MVSRYLGETGTVLTVSGQSVIPVLSVWVICQSEPEPLLTPPCMRKGVAGYSCQCGSLGLSTSWDLWSDLMNWVQSSKEKSLNFLIFFLCIWQHGVRSSLSCCMLPSFSGLAKGREFCQMLVYEQVLIAMGELMAQNWALNCIWIKGRWKRREGEEVISFFVSGLSFLLDHNPFQIPLLNHEYIVC